jgi:hypothetical protein
MTFGEHLWGRAVKRNITCGKILIFSFRININLYFVVGRVTHLGNTFFYNSIPNLLSSHLLYKTPRLEYAQQKFYFAYFLTYMDVASNFEKRTQITTF